MYSTLNKEMQIEFRIIFKSSDKVHFEISQLQ